MLDKFRKISHSPVMKVLLGLLALTFILWGVGTKSGRKDYVAIVGDKYIHKTDFVRMKRYFTRMMAQNSNKIDTETLNKVTLDNLVRSALIKAETDRLGLIIGEDVVLAEIGKMPAFKDKDGNFDKTVFKQMLDANGLTETEFVEQMKKDIAANILQSIFTNFTVSDALTDEYRNAQEQERIIDLITFNQTSNESTHQVSESEIDEYYKENKDKFTSPERRDISFIAIDANTFKPTIKVVDKEIEDGFAHLKKDKKFVITKAMRSDAKEGLIAQKAEIYAHEQTKKIEDALAAGSSLQAIADKYNLKVQTIKNLAANSVDANLPPFILPHLSDIFAFAENQAETLPNADQSSTYCVINVDKIYKPEQKALQEVKANIVDRITTEKQKQKLNEVALKLYNDVSSGKRSLPQLLSGNANVELKTIAVSRTNTQLSQNLLANIFEVKKKNGYTNLYQALDKIAFQFAVVKAIVPPKELSEDKRMVLKNQLSQYMTDTIRHELLSYLYSKHGVKIFYDSIGE